MGFLDDLIDGATDLVDAFLGESTNIVDEIADIAGVDLGPIWDAIRNVKYLMAEYFLTAMTEITTIATNITDLITRKITSVRNTISFAIDTLETSLSNKISALSTTLDTKITEIITLITDKITIVSDLISVLSASVTTQITAVYKAIGAITDILLNPASLIGLIESSLSAVW